tara:strand:- start:10216 stop:10572 length:357 start_codon:yes stop_codon:yes gene_type:complete
VKIKTKLANLVNSVEPLSKLMQKPMPSATAFRCAKLLKAVEAELQIYDEQRKKLIEKYGEDDKVDPESKNWDKFVEEMNGLLAEDVSLSATKVKEENLSKIEISPADIMNLSWLIKEK